MFNPVNSWSSDSFHVEKCRFAIVGLSVGCLMGSLLIALIMCPRSFMACSSRYSENGLTCLVR